MSQSLIYEWIEIVLIHNLTLRAELEPSYTSMRKIDENELFNSSRGVRVGANKINDSSRTSSTGSIFGAFLGAIVVAADEVCKNDNRQRFARGGCFGTLNLCGLGLRGQNVVGQVINNSGDIQVRHDNGSLFNPQQVVSTYSWKFSPVTSTRGIDRVEFAGFISNGNQIQAKALILGTWYEGTIKVIC